LVVYVALESSRLRQRRAGHVAVGALALAASLAVTATYHLGYADFRSEKVRKPVTGDLVWSVPTLVTLNPVGAPLAHAGLHVAAVTHSYETTSSSHRIEHVRLGGDAPGQEGGEFGPYGFRLAEHEVAA
jgi:hypothetical protein